MRLRLRRVIWISVVVLALVAGAFLIRDVILTSSRWRAAEGAQPPDTILIGSWILTGNQASSSLTVVEAGTGRVAGEIPVPEGPHELAVSPDSRWVVATLAGDAGSLRPPWRTMRHIAVVDLAGIPFLKMVDLGPHTSPHGVVFVDERTAAVTSAASQSIVFVDVDAGTILGAVDTGAGHPNSRPHMLAITTDRRTIYSANIDSRTVSEIDAHARTLRRHITFPGKPVAVAVSSDNTLWVIEEGDGHAYTVAVADLATGSVVSRFSDAGMARRIAMVPDHSAVIVTDPGRGEVQVYDTATRTLRSRIALGTDAGPSGVSFAPGSFAYVATGAGQIVEIDYRAGRVTRTIATPGRQPDGIVLIPRPRD